MKRLMVLLVVAGLLLASSLPLVAQPRGESVWIPDFGSPVNFYKIQVDKGTPAQSVVEKIYAAVSEKWPEAADNALHAAIAN